MEEKHPIRFSWGQFIVLLSLQVVMLGLVFVLGARFGGAVFPEFYSRQFSKAIPFQDLNPEAAEETKERSATNDRLVDSPAQESGSEARVEEKHQERETEPDEAPDAQAPLIQVGADGSTHTLEPEEESEAEAPEAQEEQQPLAVNKSLNRNPIDLNTVVRFKSSGHSKFSIEVGEFFDEMLASKRISDLKKKGYDAFLVIGNPGSSTPSYGVRVGVFSDRQVAEQTAVEMSNRQGMELRVIQVQ